MVTIMKKCYLHNGQYKLRVLSERWYPVLKNNIQPVNTSDSIITFTLKLFID